MTKEELDILGYTYTNLTSGYVGINYDTLEGADDAFVAEVLKTLAPEVTESNLIDLLVGLDEHGIANRFNKTTLTEIAGDALPELFPGEIAEAACRLEHQMDKIGTYQVDYVGYTYVFGDELQKMTKAGQAREKTLKKKMKALAESGHLSVDDIAAIATSIRGMTSVEDVRIGLFQVYQKKDRAVLYIFDRHGVKAKTRFIAGEAVEKQEYTENARTETEYKKGQAVAIRKTVTGSRGADEVIVTVPAYENNQLTKSKTTYSKRLAEGLQPTCYVYRFYAQDGSLEKAKINDAKYGKKSYTFLTNGFTAEENGNVVTYDGQVRVSDPRDPMAALKELMWLDGALVQLKRYVEEYRMDYASALNEIYTQKVNYALAAIKEEKALLYIADRGNMTIYDANYKKAAYFPIEIIKKYLPTYRKYPNVIVEQKVKESRDPKAIRRLFEFGTRTQGKDAVYAFRRVVKALSANPATPADVLAQIVEGIYAGKYDNANLAAITANPNADTDTLQLIIDHKPSILVLSHIEDHPNRPMKIKARVSEKEAQKAADSIFGN